MVVASQCGFCQNCMDVSRFNMRFAFTLTDFHEVLAEFQQQTGADYQLHGCEATLRLPEKLGAGSVRRLKLREGLDLIVNEHSLNESLVLEYSETELKHSPVALKFCVSGAVSGSIQGFGTNLCTSAEKHCLVYGSDRAGTVEFAPSSKNCTIELAIAPTLLRDMIGDADSNFPDFNPVKDLDDLVPYCQFGQTPPLMAIALQQILHCPYQGATRRLYLESKGLELISLYFEHLKTHHPKPQKPHQLKPADVSQIYQARDILIHHMENPPSLLSLARQAGINDHKLKQGFQQVFGTTVFGYLHNYRMERAAQLLQDNQITVTGVAQTVGFANRGCFAAAFRRKFGVNPSGYLAAYQKQYWDLQQKTPASDRKNSG
ncbi:MAG: AraC family transcriptional regulator [Cyanobacteria bacterium P01_E01_bin.6]